MAAYSGNNGKEYFGRWIFIGPMVCLLAIGVVPFVYIIFQSFAVWIPGEGGFVRWGSVQGYKDALDYYRVVSLCKVFGRAFAVSSIDTAVAIVFSYILVRQIGARFRMVILICLSLPFLTNEMTRAFSWKVVLGSHGLINQILSGVIPGVGPFDWFIYSEFGVIIALVATTLPLAIFPVVFTLAGIPNSVWLASQDLGGGAFVEITRIGFPLSRSAMLMAWITTFTIAIGSSVEVRMLGGVGQISLGQIVASLESANKLSGVFALTSMILFLFLIIAFFLYRVSSYYRRT